MTDPSREAIERWAKELQESADYLRTAALDDETADQHATKAALLRALLDERDAALNDAKDFHRQSEIAYAERDRAAKTAYARGHADMRERAAAEIDCGCECRAAALEGLRASGERHARRWCKSHGDACCALLAAAIRALPIKEKADE